MNHPGFKNQSDSLEQTPLPAPVQKTHNGEIWLGIYFPDISLGAHQAPQDKPFVVLERHKGHSRIYRSNPLARIQGIAPGMDLNAAYVLCQGLATSMRDEFLESVQLRACAQAAASFTPRIVLAGSDGLLLEVRASLRLFGGVRNLREALKPVFSTAHVLACAPVADAAELMARNGIGKIIRNTSHLQSALGSITLQGLPLDEKLRQKLERCGLRELRDLWRLPRPDLARRFGPGLLRYLDQLNGQRPAPLCQFEPDIHFRAKRDFEQETEDHQQLLYVARRLLKQASEFLRARVLLSEIIDFHLLYNPRNRTTRDRLILTVQAQQGGDLPEHFLPQFTEQMKKLDLESPLTALEIRIRQFKLRTSSTRELFKKPYDRYAGQSASDRWPVLLDLLFARLGRKRVYRLNIFADYRPENAWRREPVQPVVHDDKQPGAWQTDHQGVCYSPERPTWLLHQPIKCLGQRFRLVSDAERLESGWWDGGDQRREYYQGIAPSGRRCWLYRDLQAVDEQWYLHGLFA